MSLRRSSSESASSTTSSSSATTATDSTTPSSPWPIIPITTAATRPAYAVLNELQQQKHLQTLLYTDHGALGGEQWLASVVAQRGGETFAAQVYAASKSTAKSVAAQQVLQHLLHNQRESLRFPANVNAADHV
jgi:hypothetical protein